jgi:hypothetical protein
MIRFIVALALAASAVVFAQAKADVVTLPEHPTTEEQVQAVQAVAGMLDGSLPFLRMIHRNCDNTFNVVYYQVATDKWVFVQDTRDLGGPETVAALNEHFGEHEWDMVQIGSILTEAPCGSLQNMQFEERAENAVITAAVTLEQLLGVSSMWIDANPGNKYYFIVAPRCDGAAWTVFAHNAVDPEAADLFITYSPNKEHLWAVLDDEWGAKGWSEMEDGDGVLITMPDFCLALEPEISI